MGFFSSAIAGWRLNLPTALASGVGLSAFIKTYSINNGITWPNSILICGIVACIVFVASLTPIRRAFIDAIPNPIFGAIKAAIGAILTTTAIQETVTFVMQVRPTWGASVAAVLGIALFACGLSIILGTEFLYAYAKFGESQNPILQRVSRALSPCRFLLSIIILSMIILLIPSLYANAISHLERGSEIWAWLQQDALSGITGDALHRSWDFGFAILFIMTLDIAGSPVDYFKSGFGAKLSPRSRERLIDKSLRIDSGLNVLSALVGISPIVYYFENHAGWQAGGRTGLVAYIAAAGFLAAGLFLIGCFVVGWPIIQFIPRIAVMPTLFFVGLTLIADSFVPQETALGQTAPIIPNPSTRKPNGVDLAAYPNIGTPAPGQTLYFVPAAITIVIVSISNNLNAALAAGILSYAVISIFPEKYLGFPKPNSAILFIIYLSAFAVLILNLSQIDWAKIANF